MNLHRVQIQVLKALNPLGLISVRHWLVWNRLTSWVAPVVAVRAYSITADVDNPANGANGVIIAQGGRYDGFTLFVKDNRVVCEINSFGSRSGQIAGSEPLSAGRAHIVVDLVPDRGTMSSNSQPATYCNICLIHPGSSSEPFPGNGSPQTNGKPEGTGRFANVNANDTDTLDVNETLNIGSDLGSAVGPDYQSPNLFTGRIEVVSIQLK